MSLEMALRLQSFYEDTVRKVVNMNTKQLKQEKGEKTQKWDVRMTSYWYCSIRANGFHIEVRKKGVKEVDTHVQQETVLEGNMEPICILPWELSI
jgi:hypothetical protein